MLIILWSTAATAAAAVVVARLELMGVNVAVMTDVLKIHPTFLLRDITDVFKM